MNEKVQEALVNLPPKRVQTILELLQGLRTRADNGEDVTLPVATLHLCGGRDFSGWFIGQDYDRQEQCVLLQRFSSDRRVVTEDVVYLNAATIEAITIHNAGEHAHHLSFGRISIPPGKPAPTPLELKRKLVNMEKHLAEFFRAKIEIRGDLDGIPGGDESMFAFSGLIGIITGIFTELSRDKVSRESISENMEMIHICHSDDFLVKLENKTLSIGTSLAKGPGDLPARQEIKERIEAEFQS